MLFIPRLPNVKICNVHATDAKGLIHVALECGINPPKNQQVFTYQVNRDQKSSFFQLTLLI